jgi:hypothetical protein
MSAMSDYLENKIIDWLLRGQSFVPPANCYFALFTATPTDAGGGTEVSGGSYARAAVTSSLANWAGTQATASTSASSGTSGTTSNNSVITFPAPTGNWGTIVALAIMDAPTSGNILLYSPLTVSRTVNSGESAPSFPAAAFSFQLDN